MSPVWTVQGLLGWVRRVLWQMKMGLGLWPSCGGQISILGHWGNGQVGGLAPCNGPIHTWDVNKRQRRFPIGVVQGLLGWVRES